MWTTASFSAANYVTSYTYSAGTTPPVLSHAFMLQIGLRTIANSSTTAAGHSVKPSRITRPDPRSRIHS